MRTAYGYVKGARWLALPLLALLIIALNRAVSAELVKTGGIPALNSLVTIFLSILIEALPFVLIGVFVSAVIEVMVSEETLMRILPRRALSGFIAAGLMGIVFPICECGSVLIVRRLVKKGVPLYLGTTFMLAAPIVNPVVIASTSMAFTGNPDMVYLRAVGGFLVAVAAGCLVMFFLGRSRELRNNGWHGYSCACSHGHARDFSSKISHVFIHACDEFFAMGKFLIMGAFLAALIQTAVPRALLTAVGQESAPSIGVMMVLAYGLSICSEADAFVAATFASTFTTGAIFAFLVYGPMLDIKNTLMLFAAFRARYVVLLMVLVTILVFALACFINTVY